MVIGLLIVKTVIHVYKANNSPLPLKVIDLTKNQDNNINPNDPNKFDKFVTKIIPNEGKDYIKNSQQKNPEIIIPKPPDQRPVSLNKEHNLIQNAIISNKESSSIEDITDYQQFEDWWKFPDVATDQEHTPKHKAFIELQKSRECS